LSRAVIETLSPGEALAREFGLRRNPFLAEARAPDEATDAEILERLVEEVLGSVRAGHLLTVATGDNRPQLDGLVDRLARVFSETLRFLALHGDKLDLARSRAAATPRAPGRLHQSIDNIEFVVESAIRQSAALERAGLLIDHADALDQGSLLALLDFAQRSRSQKPPVQLVLVGTPGILELLTEASCARFGDITAHRFALERLTVEESRALVARRLAHAGADAKLFSEAAVDAAHALGGGYRDVLLELALWALWLAGERGASAVTPEIVGDAASLAIVKPAGAPRVEQTTAETAFHPGKLATLERPRAQRFVPPAATRARKAVPDSSGESPDAAPAAPATRRHWRYALAGAAALGLALAWMAWQPPDAPREAPDRFTAAPPLPVIGRQPEPPLEQPLEALPPVDETLVDEPAYVDIESGAVRLAEDGDLPADDLPAAAIPADTAAPGEPQAPAGERDDAAATGTAPAAAGGDDEIGRLLVTARRQIAGRRLTTPAGDNARDTLLTVLERDSGNSAARSGLAELAATYLRWGEAAEDREQWADARLYYGRALELEPGATTATAALARLRGRPGTGPAPAGSDEAESAGALLTAARNGDVVAIAQQARTGTTLDVRDARGKTPLMWAAELGHLRAARQLEARGADVNLAAASGDTALMYAAQGGRTDTVRFLLDNGARIGARNTLGWTALLYAAGGGHDAVAGELLESGADANAASEDGRTPLMAAARNGNIALVERLIAAGAAVDAVDAGDWTALMYAAWQGHSAIAQALMAAGADLDRRNVEGQTALTLGIARQHREVIDRLVQAGAQR
jgi:ankyrin repeat protein